MPDALDQFEARAERGCDLAVALGRRHLILGAADDERRRPAAGELGEDVAERKHARRLAVALGADPAHYALRRVAGTRRGFGADQLTRALLGHAGRAELGHVIEP